MELEEAEATYAKAVEQIEKWQQHPESDFAREQVRQWRAVRDANAWCLPGAARGRGWG